MELDRLPKQPEHIGIVVADMEKARAEIRALYGPLPGMDFVYEFKPDTVWTDGVKLEGPAKLRLCMIQWQGGMKMELMEPMFGGNWEHPKFLEAHGGGLHHVAYYTKEHFSAYRQLLLNQGARILFESETEDDRGYRRCCYLQCPESHFVVEIAEPPKPFPNQQA